ncbi:Prenylated rab acceptor 1 protein [Pseudoloma neurophilia]|uniref:PRA1 family protein n=1 Tax=Pseudoloma neurophilia TaxID=146866 RepID=A0A0R0M1T3_9MICR|nr:Prenylated rab acceptor 1 protein [Pseudoloma neurophilia]
MVQGEILDPMDSKSSTCSYTSIIKDTLFSAVPLHQFLDITKFSKPPKSRENIKTRCKNNFEKFKGNYFILFLICLAVFLLRELRALLLLSLWVFYFYICDNFPDVIYLNNNMSIQRHYFFYFCIFISAIFLFMFHGIIIGLAFTSAVFLTITCLHMLFYKDVEDVEEL